MTKDFKKGVLAAAAIASDYDGSTTHKFRLGDCIAMKLNVVDRIKPRRNKSCLQNPKDAWVCGFVTALAEMHRKYQNSSSVVDTADDAGVTVTVARKSKANPYDIKELRSAGVE